MAEPLLDVRSLRVTLDRKERTVTIVDDLSFRLGAGEILCIVGESGCGKTVTARSIIGLNRTDPRFDVTGAIRFEGRDLLELGEDEMRHVRGARIAMIFQDPMTSLNPLQRIGDQIGEILSIHTGLDRHAIRRRVLELLALVGIPHPDERIGDYPHQFSGGMRQRAMIAMALACEPSILIADEPTTALDVTTQKQILALIGDLAVSRGMSVILITHDLGVVAETADRVLVMYAGRCVELASVQGLFAGPRHPYTSGLLASIPVASGSRIDRLPAIPGTPPLADDPHLSGCAFRPRCGYAFARCGQVPPLVVSGDDDAHLDRCWLAPEHKPLRIKADGRPCGG